ncbi:MFS transporter (macronuclear) [Tetrahymena thermophila SB210]|uniref:MFS transporter n=1 Tax=Tetrahymena thermophila (strain SB210) TaxID=312017 RepID=Q248G2_TETTS|nr:MFS transporter [Tetrahymena thermophila SB210]EAS04083.2 MFS transporter [Tetrahymena thermophila SB210]|eukprot:XP_001024328.2 MFS transporter [Tetrahymena thermophila SB210]
MADNKINKLNLQLIHSQLEAKIIIEFVIKQYYYKIEIKTLKYKKVVDTGTSQAVPHLSTNPALRRLTSEFEWDPVFSPQYGRQQNQQIKCCRHWDFPSGPPPQYQPSLKALNFGVRMGSGVFTLVWPTTKLINQMCCRHWDFPSGPPPQYQPSLKALNFGVQMGSGVFTLVWPTTKLINQIICYLTKLLQNKNKCLNIKKGCRHWDFPSGPPPQYQPSLKALNFGVRMGSGVFTLVWPTTKQQIKSQILFVNGKKIYFCTKVEKQSFKILNKFLNILMKRI